jgi:TonB family protein
MQWSPLCLKSKSTIGNWMTMRTSRRNNAAALSLLMVVLSAIPALADPDDEGDRQSHIIDSSTERMPEVTAFPKYPLIARRDRIEGEVTVCFRIDSSGRIRDASIVSSTHKIFRKPALRAIKESSFEPLPEGEEWSAEKVCRTYRFRLDPVAAQI